MKDSQNYFFLFLVMIYFLYKVEGGYMKNRKGFTMIELLTAFVIMAFLLGIGVVSYRFIIDRVAANYYDTLEEELLLAGSDYFTNNRMERPLSGYSAVQIDELVGNKYIETLKDRNGKVCDPNSDSKVYIYKTENGYDYEVCLICNEHESSGAYCNNVAMGVINISASKEGGGSYNPLLSFVNASWSNKNVNVTFSVTVDVTDFIITDVNSGTRRTCDSITGRSCSMSFSSTSSYKVEAYNDGIEVAPAKGFNIKIDKEVPQIVYSLEEGTYDENKNVTVTVTDNRKISSVEYKLYKDDSLVSSGNPTIDNETSLNFDNNLDNSGTWKLEVTAVDAAGNTSNNSKSFAINAGPVCEWVSISGYTKTSCESIAQPDNPVAGDKYVACDGPYGSGKWRFTHSQIPCTVGNSIPGNVSGYDYGTAYEAGIACNSAWQSAENACYRQGGNSIGGVTCSTQQERYFTEETFEYQCE